MSVALHGNLRDFGIGEVFQLIGQQRKTGVLEIAGGAERIEISFAQGAVVRAAPLGPYEGAGLGDMLVRVGLLTTDQLVELEALLTDSAQPFRALVLERTTLPPAELAAVEELLTRDTIFALLRWTEGSFHFTAQPVVGSREATSMLPAEQILMDGLRMVDEWRSLDPDATCETTVFRSLVGPEGLSSALAQESEDRLRPLSRVLALVDGRRSARRVIDLSRLGTFEGARSLTQLRRTGLVAPVASEEASRLSRVAERGRGVSQPAARLAAALLPFALLGALVALVARGPAAPEPAASDALAVAAELRVELAAEARRLRHLLLAHRFARGSWPESLAGLTFAPEPDFGFLAPLAAPPEHPYYYARRGESFVLLSPSHGGGRAGSRP